jgi:hypothetical protein
MTIGNVRPRGGRAETAEGRHWYVKRNYEWLWPIVYSVVGMAILSAAMFFLGGARK